MACPRSMSQKKRKKMYTSMSMKKKRKKIYIAMSSCYPNKGVFQFHHPPSTYVHDLDQLVWFVISMDPLFDFAILVTQVHASTSPTMSSTYAIIRSRMKRSNVLVRIYTQWETWEILWRSKIYGWSLQKYFQNPRHMARKWRRLKSMPFCSSTSQAIHGRQIKIHRQRKGLE